MNPYEFDYLINHVSEENRLVTIDDLKNKRDRTLMFGYDSMCDMHVYIKGGEIYCLVYTQGDRLERNISTNQDYVPAKRAYPERCDYEFCKLLKLRGVNISFTKWTDDIEPATYYGKTL